MRAGQVSREAFLEALEREDVQKSAGCVAPSFVKASERFPGPPWSLTFFNRSFFRLCSLRSKIAFAESNSETKSLQLEESLTNFSHQFSNTGICRHGVFFTKQGLASTL